METDIKLIKVPIMFMISVFERAHFTESRLHFELFVTELAWRHSCHRIIMHS
jgi:hypothetical protein